MIRFDFTINKSFLGGSGRPITVPKSQVDYRALERIIGAARKGTIRYPNGRTAPVNLYHGNAGYGEYYQLRLSSNAARVQPGVSLGQRCTVSIGTRTGSLDVVLDAR